MKHLVKEKMTNNFVADLFNSMSRFLKGLEQNETLNLYRFFVLLNLDQLAPFYTAIGIFQMELRKQFTELNEDGSFKKKAKLLSIKKEENEQPQDDFVWIEGGKEKFDEQNMVFMNQEVEVEVIKCDIKDLLEMRFKVSDADSYFILKNISI